MKDAPHSLSCSSVFWRSKPSILAFDHQKEFVIGDAFESRNPMQRIRQSRQSVERPHTQKSRESTGQNDHFKYVTGMLAGKLKYGFPLILNSYPGTTAQ